ncbi:hypothetical protein GR302_20505 [Aeromonas caviae]|nr:hypothetical protein [Aeromonas caviae]
MGNQDQKIPESAEMLMRSSWYQGAISCKSNHQLYLGKVRTSIPRTKNENFSHLISMGYQ